MKYIKPKLYKVFPLDNSSAACLSGNNASPLGCKPGTEASSGCGSGVAAGNRCLPGAAAGGKCDSGAGF